MFLWYNIIMGFPLNVKTYTEFNGLAQNISQTNITASYALLAQNCRFRERDVRHREGYSFYNSTKPTTEPLTSTPILGLHKYRVSEDNDLLVASGGVIYVDDRTSATPTQLKDGLDDDTYYSFCNLNNYAYIVNNVNTNMKYGEINATTTAVSNMCIANPTSSGTATRAAGTVTGLTASSVYGYLYTYVNSHTGQESNPYSLTTYMLATTTSATTDKITISSIPVSLDTQVDKVNFYRTTAGGSIYDAQFLIQKNNTAAGTTTYIAAFDDFAADSTLQDTIQLFHDPAPIFKKVVTHKNRVFAFEDKSTTLYISYEYNGWYYPQGTFGDADFTLEINKDDGDFIQNIVSYIDYLIIFKSNSIWVLEGYDETDFFLRKVEYDDSIGCVGINGAIVKNNAVYFVDKKGIYVTNGNQVNCISNPVLGYFNGTSLIKDLPIDKQLMNTVCIGADTYNTNKIIKFSFVAAGNAQYSNSLHLVYNYEQNKWSIDTGYIATAYTTIDNNNIEYLVRGDDLGYTYAESTISYDGDYDSGNTTELLSSDELIDDTKNWTTNQFKGLYVYITDYNSPYYGIVRRITENDKTTLTLDSNWDSGGKGSILSYDNTSYVIGGNEFIYITGYDDYGNPGYVKRLKSVKARITSEKNYNMNIYNWYDFNTNISLFRNIDVLATGSYDSGVLWGSFYWGQKPLEELNKNTSLSEIHTYHAYGISTFDPTSKLILNNYDKIFQVKGIAKR